MWRVLKLLLCCCLDHAQLGASLLLVQTCLLILVCILTLLCLQ